MSLRALLLLLVLFAPTAHAKFADVDDDYPYRDAIRFLEEKQVVSGYNDRTFKPDAIINRAEFTKIIVSMMYPYHVIAQCVPDFKNNTALYEKLHFFDIDYDAWYGPSICTAQMFGLIGGYLDGTFRPEQRISIVEAAKILSIAFHLNVVNLPNLGELNELWYRPYVKTLEDLKAIPPSIVSFEQPVRRGEMAEMIYRLWDTNRTEDPTGYRTYSDLVTQSPLSSYSNTTHGFQLLYPSQWGEPIYLGRGVYDERSPYARSLWRLYLGPKYETTGYGEVIERDYFIDGYDPEIWDDAVGGLVVDTSVTILSDRETNTTFTVVYEEKGANCVSKKALILTDTSLFRLTANCGKSDPKVEREFDRLLETFKVIKL